MCEELKSNILAIWRLLEHFLGRHFGCRPLDPTLDIWSNLIEKTASNGLKKGFEANSGSELKNLIIGPKTRDFGLSGLRQPQATSSGLKKVLKWSLDG